MKIQFPLTLPDLPRGAKWLCVCGLQTYGSSRITYTVDVGTMDVAGEHHEDLIRKEVGLLLTVCPDLESIDLAYLSFDDTVERLERIPVNFFTP